MKQGENLKRKNRPTMQQLQYLTELEKIEKKRGSISQIAQICGVNHAAVSRYFKGCVEQGILTEEFEFTEATSMDCNGIGAGNGNLAFRRANNLS